MDAGDTLLKLLRVDCETDFEMYLTSVHEDIPYFFLAGCSNYARYTPVYVAEMPHLEVSAPQMFHHMSEGGFVVKRSEKGLSTAFLRFRLSNRESIARLKAKVVSSVTHRGKEP